LHIQWSVSLVGLVSLVRLVTCSSIPYSIVILYDIECVVCSEQGNCALHETA